VYETPGGTHPACTRHRQVESLTMDREVMHLRDALIPKYAELVYNGFWFAPEREALQALRRREPAATSSGTVRLKLYKGNIITCRPQVASTQLYDTNIAIDGGREPSMAYNQSDATGFIRLNGLRLRARSLAQGGPKV
jgi:argininosuccinate synthase